MTNKQGEYASVLYVDKKNAKCVKNKLEQLGLLRKDLRMRPVEETTDGARNGCIAVPIFPTNQDNFSSAELDGVMDFGTEYCPYSSSQLGNRPDRCSSADERQNSSRRNDASIGWTPIEKALIHTIKEHSTLGVDEIADQTLPLLSRFVPKSLQILGDDHTLVISRNHINPEDDQDFTELLQSVCDKNFAVEIFMKSFWTKLASEYKSPRVVRKGEIDPNSGTRQSGYRLLWPVAGIPETKGVSSNLFKKS